MWYFRKGEEPDYDGAWVVREVVKVDEEKRQIWFQGSGMYPGKGSVLHALLPH
jgi:hypothetical protein